MTHDDFTAANTFNGDVATVLQAGRMEVRTGPAAVVPREGPIVHDRWTGRERDVAAIEASLSQGRPVAISGDDGIGKSVVAAMVIDRNRDRYEHGQIYIDLDVEEPSKALLSVLIRLDVAPDQIPPGIEGRLALYRSVTRGRTLLVVVDGVSREREADLLRPASAAAGYLVVTRTALRDDAFAHHELGPLSPEAAADYLRGACPNLADGVVPRLVDEFGTRPADLRGLAGLVQLRSLSGLVEVREALGGSSLFTGLYDGLSESARWLYRLLGTLPNREFERALIGIFTGASGWTSDGTPAAFTELVDAQLVTEHRPGWYRVETGIAGGPDRPSPDDAVPVELFSGAYDSLAWHVHRARRADQAVMADRQRFAPPPRHRVTAPGFDDGPAAMEWFRTLYPALHDSVLIAARRQWTELAWPLAEALWAYYANTSRHREASACYREVLAVADEPLAVAHLSSLLGMCLLGEGDLVEAGQVLDRGFEALEEADSSAEPTEDSVTRRRLRCILTEVLGRLRHRQGRHEAAAETLLLSIAYAEELGWAKAIGVRLRALAEVNRDQGELERAERTWERAVERFIEAGDERNRHGAGLDIAMMRYRRGDADALAAVEDGIEQMMRLGLWQTAAETHEGVAAVLAERGEGSMPSNDRLKRALRLYEAHGAPIDAARVRRRLGVSEPA